MAPLFLSSSGNLQADRRYEYAKAMAESGSWSDAIELLTQTLELAPEWPVLPFTLGRYSAAAGQYETAMEWFKKSLTLDPDDHQGALLEMQILGMPVIAQAMPAAFVQTLFDQYAPRFDAHLTEALSYNVPRLIAGIIAGCRPNFVPARILDLGCGTGLAVETYAQVASWIEGVDLSSGMLAQAETKRLYHRLAQADLLAYLQESTDKFDLILAADALIYFGDLAPVMQAVALRLPHGGLLAFSVQKPSGALDFHLDETHRFSHAEAYIARLLAEAGLRIIAREEHVLRCDRGQDVWGSIYLCTGEAPIEIIPLLKGRRRRRGKTSNA